MHLHVQAKLLQEIVRSFSGTTCQPIQHMLRRICVQLCDLASPTALLIMRTVLDLIVEDLQRYFSFCIKFFFQVILDTDRYIFFHLEFGNQGLECSDKIHKYTPHIHKYTYTYTHIYTSIFRLFLIRIFLVHYFMCKLLGRP